jgi:hypothetical protein
MITGLIHLFMTLFFFTSCIVILSIFVLVRKAKQPGGITGMALWLLRRFFGV